MTTTQEETSLIPTEAEINYRRPVESSPLMRLADKHGMDFKSLEAILIKTVIKVDASREEILAFIAVCDRYGLDPITKQVYAMKAKGGGLVPIVSVDGWATLVAKDPRCDGFTFIENNDENGFLVSVTCRMGVVGRKIDTEVTEYLSECKQSTQPWTSHPRRMLRHRALVQSARIVFGIGGIYDEDEGQVIADAPVRQLTDREEGADRCRANLENAVKAKAARDGEATDAVVVAETPTEPPAEPQPLLPTIVTVFPVSARRGVTNDKKKNPYLIVQTTDRDTFRVFRTTLFEQVEKAIADQSGLQVTIEKNAITEIHP